MKNKIKKILKRNYKSSLISIFSIILFFHVQSFAQWENTNLPSIEKVNTLIISDSNIFAGTNGDGIFVSTDNGETWISINNGLQSKVIYKIFINGTTIFAGTESGASISTDYGLNWSTINSGLSGNGVWSFAASNNQFGDTTIFAGTWSGVYATTDNGKNWEVRGLTDTESPVHSIIIHDEFVYAATLAGGVFNSQHNGYSWDHIGIWETDRITGITALLPVYSLAIIDTIVITSAVAGRIYYMSFSHPSFLHYKTVSNRPILCFAIRNSNLFAGNSDGYIFLSANYGSDWAVIHPPITHQAIYTLALNYSYIFAGTESGVWRLPYPSTVTNVDNYNETPTGFALEQNYPNPFNPVTTIKYSIPNFGENNYSYVQLKVYNILGQEVAVLVNKQQAPGKYRIKFDGSNLTSGIYIYKLQAGSFVSTKKLMLLK